MRLPGAIAPLLAALGRAGVELSAHPIHPERLRHRPASLPADLAASLRLYKPALLALLQGEGLREPEGEAGYVLNERLGVADELAMPTHPGSPGWLVAVGESLDTCCTTATAAVECNRWHN